MMAVGGKGGGLEVLDKCVVKVWTVTIMARHEGWSCRRPAEMKITAVKKTVNEYGSAQLKGTRGLWGGVSGPSPLPVLRFVSA